MARPAYLRIKNFERYQHGHARSYKWIKLYKDLPHDPEFFGLPPASKWHYVALLLLASKYDNRIRTDEEWLKNELGITSLKDLNPLIKSGFVLATPATLVADHASNTKQTLLAASEERREEEEEEKTQNKKEDEREKRKEQEGEEDREESQREGKGETNGKIRPAARGSALANDFILTAERERMAVNIGVRKPGTAFAQFRAYHEAKGTTFKSWEAAWRNWCFIEVKKHARV